MFNFLITLYLLVRFVSCIAKGTFTHARSGGGRKVGFNTNHYMRSHMHGHRAEVKSTPQQMGPTPNFPCPLLNRALQTIFVLKKWQIRPRPLRVYVNIPAVAELRCQNPPVSAPHPFHAYVNVAWGTGTCIHLIRCWVLPMAYDS